MGVYIGLDIGGTKFIAAAADQDGRILRRMRLPGAGTLEEDLAILHHMVQATAAGEEIFRMGAAVGGPLDWESGVVSPLHQPAWRDVPLRRIMEQKWNCPFLLDVDTNIAALGEYYSNTNFPSRFLYLTLSTGMGGGFLRGWQDLQRCERNPSGDCTSIHPVSLHVSIQDPMRVRRTGLPRGVDLRKWDQAYLW